MPTRSAKADWRGTIQDGEGHLHMSIGEHPYSARTRFDDAQHPVTNPEELIAAEIKTDTQQLIVAFGQAVAYRLFAHRVYLVVPRNSPKSDLQRLDALASVVGIGLVLFDAASPARPEFDVRVRAPKHEPDYFYTNQVVAQCASELFA